MIPPGFAKSFKEAFGFSSASGFSQFNLTRAGGIFRRRRALLFAAALSGLAICSGRAAVDLEQLGGVVIDQFNGANQYVADPAIVVMPDGSYVAAHSWFGSAAPSGTRVFRSTDKGATWTLMSQPSGTKKSLFAHGGALYLIGGFTTQVQKSTNNGATWSAAITLPGSGSDSTTCVPQVHNGRVYLANGMRVISASLSTDLMLPASWTVSNEWLAQPAGSASWLGGSFTLWHEGQAVASPLGIFLMPNISDQPTSALLRCNAAGTSLTFNSDTDATAGDDFVDLPGADKKFGVFYDSVSGLYFALTNPVLPEHGGYGGSVNEDLIRNAAALYSSPDLVNWTQRSIFLYSHNRGGVNGELGDAFQYLQGVPDGNDLVIVARTSLKDGAYTPPRGHDANLFTFHRLKNFRDYPRRVVLLSNTGANKVQKYERGLTARLAPLGSFTSTVMSAPYGVTQTNDGDVFVSEKTATGRILRFSEAGALEATVATPGSGFSGTPGALTTDGTDVFLGTTINRIYKINGATNALSVFVPTTFTSTVGSGTLSAPLGLAFDGSGNFYVNDSGNSLIRKFHATTGSYLGDFVSGKPTPQALAANLSQSRLLFSWQGGGHTNIGRATVPSGSTATFYNLSGLGTAYGILGLDDETYWSDSTQGVLSRSLGSNAKEDIVTGLNAPSHLWAMLPKSSPLVLYNLAGQPGSQVTTPTHTVVERVTATAISRGASYGATGAVAFGADSMLFSPGSTTGNTGFLSNYDLNFAVANNGYFQITLTPASGYSLFIDSVLMAVRRASASSGPNFVGVRSSLDGYGSDLATGISTAGTQPSPTTVAISFGQALKDITTPVTLRFYGYTRNATSSSFGLWGISNPSSGKLAVMGRVVPAAGGPTGAALRAPAGGSSEQTKTAATDKAAAPTPTPTPKPVPSAIAGDGQVELNWKPAEGAVNYEIHVGLAKGGPHVPLTTTTETTYVDRSLTNGMAYFYQITAVKSSGDRKVVQEFQVVPRKETP